MHLLEVAMQGQSKMNKKWLIRLGLVAAVALILAAIFRILTPTSTVLTQTEFVQKNLDGSSTVFVDVTFTGQKPTFPSSLPLARITTSEESIDVILETLLSKYQLEENPDAPNVWESQNNTMLVRDLYSEKYTLFFPQLPSELEEISQDQLIDTTSSFLNQTFGISLTPLVDQIQYLAPESETTLVSETTTDERVLSVPYSSTIEGIPVYFEKNVNPSFTVNITTSGEILALLFYPDLTVPDIVGHDNIIPVDEAVNNIKQNKAAVISSYFKESVGEIDLTTLSSVDLKLVTLEYRQDPDNNLIYPFYRFAGSAIDPEQKKIDISVITPAIPTR